MYDPDGFASYQIGRAAQREIGVRRRDPGYEPSPLRPHEARWAHEGERPFRELETVRDWLASAPERPTPITPATEIGS